MSAAKLGQVHPEPDQGNDVAAPPIGQNNTNLTVHEDPGKNARQHASKKESGLFQFSNTEAIKQKVRERKVKGCAYNVHDFYHDTGFFQKVAKAPVFENVTLGIIVVNALWISIDTDLNKGDTMFDGKAHKIFMAADFMFFGYFSGELFIRFMAFKRKRDGLKDGWFVFDSTLVSLYAFDPFALGIAAAAAGGGGVQLPTAVLRLFRLARLSRLVRMLRSLPELMIMIKGMMSAAASVGYTLALLMLATYVFAIALRNLVPPASFLETQYFSSVLETMHTLIIFGTFLDALSDWMYAVMGFVEGETADLIDIRHDHIPCFILCWIYIALASLTILNMLIGVLCEVISAVASEEKESMIVDKVHERFGDIVKKLDENNDGDLTWEEFTKLLDYPEAIAALESVNVDPSSMIDVAEDFLFDNGNPVKVSFDEFMGMVLDLRGGQSATVKDIMSLGKHFNRNMLKTREKMEAMEKKFDGIDEKIAKLLS